MDTGQSICGPSQYSVWGPQRPRYAVNLWGPHQNVGPSVTRNGQWICGALSPSAGALNKVWLLVDVWNPGGFVERLIYGALIKS